MDNEILKFCSEKGFLLDGEVLNLLSETGDINLVKTIIERVRVQTQKKMITKSFFVEDEKAQKIFSSLPESGKVEKLKIKLGLDIEISKEIIPSKINQEVVSEPASVKINLMPLPLGKKLEVQDFVKFFRSRYNEMKSFLYENQQIENLVSIDKIYGSRQGISVIGLVYDKRVTKNGNLLFEIEDLSGRMKVVVNKDKEELYALAEEVALDSVVAFKGSGSKEILFANEVFLPESRLEERKVSPVEESVVFIGDLHFGSKLFFGRSFLKFIDYLNGKVKGTEEEVKKIKYLFIVGDLVTGIGNYPNQEKDLVIKNLEDQFLGIAGLLGKIRKDIKIIISPGNHDCVRLMEPQPLFDEKYSWPLYNLENVTLTTNPSEVNIASREGFSGFNVLTYHGFSFPYYSDNVPRLMKMKAFQNSPQEVMKYLLVHRHLAPTHASMQYFPSEEDNLIIKNIPDILLSGHSHKSGVVYHNNILVVSVSCWQAVTAYQEKLGAKPDMCKVPMFNLKTRQVKILDFEDPKDREEKKDI